MKAVFVEGPGKYRVEDRDEPVPAAGEALVRVVAAGICATDVGVIEGQYPIAKYPLVPGHECVGVVEMAPSGAETKTGDWVSVFPSVGCGECAACKAGVVNHCPALGVYGLSHENGVFAEKLSVPVGQLLSVPENLRGDTAVLIEPTAVGVHVIRRIGAAPLGRVLIIGAGVIGILTAQLARAHGAQDIILVDRLESRRKVLDRLGFDNFIVTSGDDLAERIVEVIERVDTVFDNVCSDSTIDACLDVLAPGGRIVMVASPHGEHAINLSFPKVYTRELSLIAARNYVPDDFREAARLLSEGAVDGMAIVTAVRPLAEFEEVYAELLARPEDHLKVLLQA